MNQDKLETILHFIQIKKTIKGEIYLEEKMAFFDCYNVYKVMKIRYNFSIRRGDNKYEYRYK